VRARAPEGWANKVIYVVWLTNGDRYDFEETTGLAVGVIFREAPARVRRALTNVKAKGRSKIHSLTVNAHLVRTH
jgi:hypothetical protein